MKVITMTSGAYSDTEFAIVAAYAPGNEDAAEYDFQQCFSLLQQIVNQWVQTPSSVTTKSLLTPQDRSALGQIRRSLFKKFKDKYRLPIDIDTCYGCYFELVDVPDGMKINFGKSPETKRPSS